MEQVSAFSLTIWMISSFWCLYKRDVEVVLCAWQGQCLLIDTAAGSQGQTREAQDLILRWSNRRACTMKELESFIGHLCHAATVVCHFSWHCFSYCTMPRKLITLFV